MMLLTVPLALIFAKFIEISGDKLPYVLLFTTCLFQLLISYIFPVIIQPLFSDYSDKPSEDEKEALMQW